MTRLILSALIAALCSQCFADRAIFLVTPAGVWQSTVVDGKPGPWKPIAADVIVQGFPTGGPPDTDPPIAVPPGDAIVDQIAAISKATLKGQGDATVIAAVLESIGELNLAPSEFREAVEMALPIADASFDTGGRFSRWGEQSLAVTTDPKKLKAGLVSAFGVIQSTLDSIRAATANDGHAVGESLKWTKLIEILLMILTLLKNLGIGGDA